MSETSGTLPSAPSAHGPWMRASRATGLLRDEQAQATIFARMSALAASTGAANLGQGFPDTDPPEPVAEAAVAAIRGGVNQYPPGRGEAVLREAIAAHQRRRYGLTWDPDTEVLVTTGATEALAATLLALLEPGDEVLTLEPFYDQYAAMIALAGGVHRTVPIAITDDGAGTLELDVDPEVLAAAVGPRTRVILLNTPHNPTGLLLGEGAQRALLAAAQRHDAVIVTDEVYEHLVFDGFAHRPIAALPGAAERTVSISSAGKTFSVTGWKIGWVTARPALLTAVLGVKQWLTFVSGAPFQGAVAAGLSLPEEELSRIATDLAGRRDLLVGGLREIGFRVSRPSAGYFALADPGPFGEHDAAALAERLPAEAGVVGIPLGAFYRPEAEPVVPVHGPDPRTLLRLAFCKDRPTIERALEGLESWARDR